MVTMNGNCSEQDFCGDKFLVSSLFTKKWLSTRPSGTVPLCRVAPGAPHRAPQPRDAVIWPSCDGYIPIVDYITDTASCYSNCFTPPKVHPSLHSFHYNPASLIRSSSQERTTKSHHQHNGSERYKHGRCAKQHCCNNYSASDQAHTVWESHCQLANSSSQRVVKSLTLPSHWCKPWHRSRSCELLSRQRSRTRLLNRHW